MSRKGDLWVLGDHRLVCGDATHPKTYERLLGDERASMVFTDPPYNLPARDIGRVCEDQHGDFAMAAGEMTPEAFTSFLTSVIEPLCRFSVRGRSTTCSWIGGTLRKS